MAVCSPNSLVAKPLSDLYYDSSSNFQSNDRQQVQYDTDLLNPRQGYLYRKHGIDYKRDETIWKNIEMVNILIKRAFLIELEGVN